MSMDLGRTEELKDEQIEQIEQLSKRAEETDDEIEFLSILFEALGMKLTSPKAIVLHPSIIGRELAWSSARIDFWFNDINGLSSEAELINGGKEMPMQYRNISFSDADTWQFYERDSVVHLSEKDGLSMQLTVLSNGLPGKNNDPRSHFSVSMFKYSKTLPSGSNLSDDEFDKLPELENEIQSMLDWLAVNHHDFIRLNDFSEAFSILRWLKTTGTQLTIIDLDGENKAIATPDNVILGDGPKVTVK